MATKPQDPDVFKLKEVRLSFPHLFEAHSMEEGQEKKFSVVCLLDNAKHGAILDAIEERIERLMLDEFKKKTKPTRDLIRDGNLKPELDGYGDGVSFITATRRTRPSVVNRDLSPIAAEDNIIYAGCYANVSIRLWVQNNKFGKAVNAELRVVQFVRDGESFGAGPINPEDEFDALDDEAPSSNTTRSRAAKGGSKEVSLDDF